MAKLRFIPNFDVSEENLDTKTYQIRKTPRSAESLQELKRLISLQGQVEPIQVVVKDNKNYLIAGEGRVLCLRELGLPARALVYEGLSESDIKKISFGTNDGRIDMSPWDRIASVGDYNDNTENVNIADVGNRQSVVCVFGITAATALKYLKLWDFYKERPEFIEFFESFNVPLYVIYTVFDVISPYDEIVRKTSKMKRPYRDVVEDIKQVLTEPNMSAKKFIRLFTTLVTDFIVKTKTDAVKKHFDVDDEVPVDSGDVIYDKRAKKLKNVNVDDFEGSTEEGFYGDDISDSEDYDQIVEDIHRETKTELMKKTPSVEKTYKDVIRANNMTKAFDSLDNKLTEAILKAERLEKMKMTSQDGVPSKRVKRTTQLVNKLTKIIIGLA